MVEFGFVVEVEVGFGCEGCGRCGEGEGNGPVSEMVELFCNGLS